MNEAETRAELIDPALAAAGWGKVDGSRVRREIIAPGRLIGAGKRGKTDIADYVLVYRGQKLAVIVLVKFFWKQFKPYFLTLVFFEMGSSSLM